MITVAILVRPSLIGETLSTYLEVGKGVSQNKDMSQCCVATVAIFGLDIHSFRRLMESS